jgi:tRNA threonylcarbamoyladenosine biosynthesis protein TsaE
MPSPTAPPPAHPAPRRLVLHGEPQMLAFGRALGRALRPGMFIALSGELGSGKTTLTRGMLAGLGHAGTVRSPTYSLVEPYSFSKLDFYHFDLFRFEDELEWLDSGFRDHFNPRSVCVVEWPERAPHLLPQPDLQIRIAASGGGRELQIDAFTETGQRCLDNLQYRAEDPAG